ncbi:hypothetical protein J3R82DRAFT_8466 [Butyriboletus roseoflavus]|nr:hypothetical protein J3R82DRAFT_8466 [Butyriboletus roseoflavus]
MRPLKTWLSLPPRPLHTKTDDTRQLLRELLRETAHTPKYHGATLSSFSSIALDPLPLVAFSLRVPSRMASALNAHHVPPSPSSSGASSAHLIINVLSAAQPHLADRFARPDLHPRPFHDPRVPYTLSQDGLPILAGTLGALSCRLIGPSWPLAHLRGLRVWRNRVGFGVVHRESASRRTRTSVGGR